MIPFVAIALLSLVAQLVLPWWSVALVAFVVCYWRSASAGTAFWQGFLGIAIVWLVYALVVHSQSGGIMTSRMSQLLFKTSAPVGLILLTTAVGGLVGGLAALSGYFCRQAVGGDAR